MKNNTMGFDLFRMGYTVILIVIGSITIFLKRDEIKKSYIGSLYVIFSGLILLLMGIANIYSLNENVSTSLLIDFLLFKNISAKGAIPYLRGIGYILLIIGIEIFIVFLLRDKNDRVK